jgi:hypothetical protein
MANSKLLEDLESDAFKGGVNNCFWDLDSVIGNSVYVWVYAPDDQAYLMKLECSSYGDEPILGWFLDPVTREHKQSAYPRGDARFEGWVKFQHWPTFICWDQDRGGIEQHTDWWSLKRWQTPNQIVTYLDFFRGLLHNPANGYERKYSCLVVPSQVYDLTITGLESRSEGRRESAAIWIGSVENGTWRAEEAVFHHDLCDDKAGSHYMELAESAKFLLYNDLAKRDKQIVAMIHTHPGDWVGLSHIDANNQLSSRVGFWSLVLPQYGRQPIQIDRIGFHVRTRCGWNHLENREVHSRFQII